MTLVEELEGCHESLLSFGEAMSSHGSQICLAVEEKSQIFEGSDPGEMVPGKKDGREGSRDLSMAE